MMWLRKFGGERVGPGDYWDLHNGERVHFAADEVLPGDAATAYYKLPPVAVLLAAPFAGLAYALFLPFIGIAVTVGAAATKTVDVVASGLLKAASFGWRPSEAYLVGQKAQKRAKDPNKAPASAKAPRETAKGT